MSGHNFILTKAAVVRFARTLEHADSPEELRAMLLADASAPYHNYNVLSLLSSVGNLTEPLVDLMSDDLDEDGVPA